MKELRQYPSPSFAREPPRSDSSDAPGQHRHHVQLHTESMAVMKCCTHSRHGGAAEAELDEDDAARALRWRDAETKEAVEGAGAVHPVGGGEAVERTGAAAVWRQEAQGFELGDELQALGLVVGGGDEIADVGLLELLGGLDDRVEVGEAVVHLALSLVVPQLDLVRHGHVVDLSSLLGFRFLGLSLKIDAGISELRRDKYVGQLLLELDVGPPNRTNTASPPSQRRTTNVGPPNRSSL
ncbi:uncharacterized protein A4U43_C03F22590 [Asparagus officinalis]|uniref:Uncharacterized protein n=1 Tax=Asparagus officinalis TaxID=4686 RepID=A0A5P1FH58_ASPOF|nr:uncharacterized protein A4U43_C03F22590 [Asparagus officinalis]